MPIGLPEFIENQENRCPVIFVLDTSGSMQGEPIAALNEGIKTFKQDVLRDTQAMLSVEVSIITFGDGVKQIQDFVTIDHFEPPQLKADALTPMGEAINLALNVLEQRKTIYKTNGIPYYRPWVFLITDGAPRMLGKVRPKIYDRQKQKIVCCSFRWRFRARIWKFSNKVLVVRPFYSMVWILGIYLCGSVVR